MKSPIDQLGFRVVPREHDAVLQHVERKANQAFRVKATRPATNEEAGMFALLNQFFMMLQQEDANTASLQRVLRLREAELEACREDLEKATEELATLKGVVR